MPSHDPRATPITSATGVGGGGEGVEADRVGARLPTPDGRLQGAVGVLQETRTPGMTECGRVGVCFSATLSYASALSP